MHPASHPVMNGTSSEASACRYAVSRGGSLGLPDSSPLHIQLIYAFIPDLSIPKFASIWRGNQAAHSELFAASFRGCASRQHERVVVATIYIRGERREFHTQEQIISKAKLPDGFRRSARFSTARRLQ
jgi:hypothetical protein